MLIYVNLLVPCFAQRQAVGLLDGAKVLTSQESEDLVKELDEISERQKVDVLAVTVDSLKGEEIEAYANDMYNSLEYGYGQNRDGVLLLISTQDRQWWISTHAFAQTALTQEGINYISDKFLPYMKKDDYAKAISTYAKLTGEFIEQARTGKPYDSGHMPKDPFNFMKSIIISLSISVVVSLLLTSSMKAQLKSVRAKKQAYNYIDRDNININQSQDIFLYNKLEKSPKSQASPKPLKSNFSSNKHNGSGGKF